MILQLAQSLRYKLHADVKTNKKHKHKLERKMQQHKFILLHREENSYGN